VAREPDWGEGLTRRANARMKIAAPRIAPPITHHMKAARIVKKNPESVPYLWPMPNCPTLAGIEPYPEKTDKPQSLEGRSWPSSTDWSW
jgi:hypothetical protein